MAYRSKKSKPVFVLLTLFGFFLVFIGASLIASGCVLTLHGNFQDSSGLEDKIDIEYDYSHYWTGGTYLLTAALTLWSGCRQTKRRLTFITAAFLLFSLAISLFAIVLDGPDWVEWKNIDRTIKFWERKENFSCQSANDTCTCSQDNGLNLEVVSTVSDCDQVVHLATIYGIIVSGAVVGAVLCLATLLVMVNSISWKNPWKAYASYSTSYSSKGVFNDVMEFYKERQGNNTVASSSTLSIGRQNQEYMPAWSLYGAATEQSNNRDSQ